MMTNPMDYSGEYNKQADSDKKAAAITKRKAKMFQRARDAAHIAKLEDTIHNMTITAEIVARDGQKRRAEIEELETKNAQLYNAASSLEILEVRIAELEAALGKIDGWAHVIADTTEKFEELPHITQLAEDIRQVVTNASVGKGRECPRCARKDELEASNKRKDELLREVLEDSCLFGGSDLLTRIDAEIGDGDE